MEISYIMKLRTNHKLLYLLDETGGETARLTSESKYKRQEVCDST